MYLTSTTLWGYSDRITANSVVGFDILNNKSATQALIRRAFFMPISLWWAVLGTSVRRSSCFGMSTCTVRHPLLDINSGDSQTKQENTAMTHTIAINNIDLPALSYNNKPVVTFRMIDTVHQRPESTARRNFRNNKKRFTEGKHYYLIETMQADYWVYLEIRSQLDNYFCKEVVGAGKSWTPTLKGKWKKLLNEQLPARPDWLAIEQQVKQLTSEAK